MKLADLELKHILWFLLFAIVGYLGYCQWKTNQYMVMENFRNQVVKAIQQQNQQIEAIQKKQMP